MELISKHPAPAKVIAAVVAGIVLVAIILFATASRSLKEQSPRRSDRPTVSGWEQEMLSRSAVTGKNRALRPSLSQRADTRLNDVRITGKDTRTVPAP